MSEFVIKPADIEEKSMKIIEEELRSSLGSSLYSFSENELVVLKRVIHASADLDFSKNIRFIEDACGRDLFKLKGDPIEETSGRGSENISDKGKKNVIISDTAMILSGINKKAMEELSTAAYCFMGEAHIAQTAKERGITRAVASMEYAAKEYPEGIYLVGNAPTALIKLCELIEEGKIRPALIAGVPVGFVNVTESKELALEVCRKNHIPAILSMGRKGGSTIAVAIINALMYAALKKTDPHKRM